MSPHQEIRSIQFLRALACLSVLFFHLSFIEEKYSAFGLIPAMGQYGVDLFFVISGFVLTWLYRDKFGQAAEAPGFLFRRLLRIYPPYWQFTLLVLTVWLLNPQWVNSSFSGQPDTLKSFLLWPQETDPLLAVGWSLVFEMYFYLVFCLLFLAPARYAKRLFLGWAAAAFLLYNFAPQTPVIRTISSPLVFEFMAGCAVAWATRKCRPGPILLLLAALAWWSFASHLLQGLSHDIYRAVCYGPAFSFLLWACIEIERVKPDVVPALVRTIGNASYSIYLSHVLVLSAIGRAWQYFDVAGVFQHLIWLFSMVLAAILVGIANYHLVEKPVIFLGRRLLLQPRAHFLS